MPDNNHRFIDTVASPRLCGRAVAALVPCLVTLGLLAAGCQREEPSTPPPPQAKPSKPSEPAWFRDVTATSGVKFVHDSGAAGRYFMPESIGSGGALFDFDNDGRLDLYLVHCVPPGSSSRNQLYHQQPDGTFRDASAGSGLDVSGHGMGVAAGDVNNDGLPDMLLTEYGAARLFVNRGQGKFQDITSAAGIDNTRWGMSASFMDYDRDGWLDFVIANYVDYVPTQKCFDTRGVQEFCGPQGLAGTVTRLFRNRSAAAAAGRVVFEDVTVASGLAARPGPGMGVVCADFDGDRWPDILIADDGQANRLFMNQRNGTFAEEAIVRGVAFNAMGGAAANMGIALGDVDGDALFDLFVTHLAWEQHSLWKQRPRGLFQEQTAAAGLANAASRGTGFGAVFADFNLDGAPDLAVVNGAIKRVQPSTKPAHDGAFWSAYAQRHQLFANDGAGRFRDVSAGSPDFCARPSVGRGLAQGDLDNDGAPDLVAMNTGTSVQLLRNLAPDRGQWLTVRAIDPSRGGRDAIGAEVLLEGGGRRWWGLVQPGSSYLVSNDPRVHFGLGRAAAIDRVRVVWPDGSEEIFPGGAANRLVVLRKGGGAKP